MMNVNLTIGAQGAQAAETAGATSAAGAVDAALFQNLIAAALLQKGGTGLQGMTAALTSDATDRADAEETEGADLALLMRLLLGGGARIREPAANGAETVLSRDALLSAIAEAPAEELVAASTGSLTAEALALFADAGAIAGTRVANVANVADDAWANAASVASAADASVNGAVIETLLSNAEAADMPPRAALAADLKALLGEGAARAEPPVAVKAVRLDAPLADGESRHVPQGVTGASAESTPRADLNATSEVAGDETPANGFAEKSAESPDRIDASKEGGESGAARISDGAAVPASAISAANAASPQDGIAATPPEATVRTATPSETATRPEPYSQIARELFAVLADKQLPTTLSMRLEPAELGRIDVSMKLTSAGKLVIDIAAESAKTQALLAGQTDKLVQALGLQNVQVESVNTGLGTAFQGQQPAYAYGDRSMAFFMDLAQGGGREEESDRDGKGTHSQDGQTVAGLPAEEETPAVARYARRLDLTA
jgi:flagellar hook-length control protein FliK